MGFFTKKKFAFKIVRGRREKTTGTHPELRPLRLWLWLQFDWIIAASAVALSTAGAADDDAV